MSTIAERKSHVGTFLLGLLLLLFGVLLLMNRAGVVDLNFTRIAAFAVLIIGGFEAITAFAYSNQRRLFWGSTLFLSALLVLLVSYEYIPGSWSLIWPSALIIPGLAFLMLFFSHPKEYALLIIAALFVVVGWSGLMAQKGDYGFGDGAYGTLRVLVPAAVVAAGVYIIWKNFLKAHK
jgi:hypothetical protein